MHKRRNSSKPVASNTTKHEITTPLRRSSRLLDKSLQDLPTDSPKRLKNCAEKDSKKRRKSNESSLLCAIPVIGCRRSPRISNRIEKNSSIRQSSRLSLLAVVQKNGDNKSKKIQGSSFNKSNGNNRSKMRTSDQVLVKKREGKEGANSCNKIAQRSERKTQNSVNSRDKIAQRSEKNTQNCVSLQNKIAHRSKRNTQNCVNSHDKIAQRGDRKTQNCVNCSVVIGLEAVKRREKCEKNKEIFRVAKKQKRGEEYNNNSNGSIKGWTKEQELALQRAYLVAKPTPNFWKQVSKLVPGKSAQDCFDKVHSDHITPPQPLPQSRARRMNSSPLAHFSLSAGKMRSPSGLKAKKISRSKPKSHIAHKTVRQLLQKHNHVDQNYEADLFSILEPNVNPSTQDVLLIDAISTPKCLQQKQGFFQKCHERSPSGQKKPLSRLRNFCRMNLVSPPVLKQVKNKVLHEKYIDQLHLREEKRKKACARAGKENNRQINIQKTDVVRAAKNALVSDARNAIHKLQHLQTNGSGDSSDLGDDDCVDSDDDESDRL